MTTQPDRQNGDGLLPCPFCGNAPVIMEYNFVFHAFCQPCGCTLEAEKWNTRATQPTGRPTPDAMRRALEPFAKVEYDVAFWERDDPVTIDSSKVRFEQAGLTVGHFWDARAAISAPVPGAVREKVRLLAQKIRTSDMEQMGAARFVVMTLLIPEHDVEDFADALYSAPVPPADGARAPSALRLNAAQNTAESDPSVTLDCRGAETIAKFSPQKCRHGNSNWRMCHLCNPD